MSEIPPLLHQHLAGRYVLKREIGRGGAATVFLAHDLRHERLVAIKVLHTELSHALGAQRFMREIKLTASLQHPHILPIHDSGEAGGHLFYVMPYVEGDNLRHRLGADNRLSVEEAVRIGREVAGALAYAHERGVVHRDIKPENILFSGGHAVLADFGIARAINRASEKITQQGTITGTPAYMSPEQARDRAFDGRSDVYSLACVMYEAIAGVPPFVGDTPQALLSQRIQKTPPLLREYRHDVPTPVEAVIAKALAISPDDRYDDARAFSAALSAAIGNSGESVVPFVGRRSWMRSPWLAAAGVTLLIAGGAATSPRVRDQFDLMTGRVDSAEYAVLPFQYVGAAAPAADAEPVASALYDAMRRWEGLPLAGEMAISDAMRAQQTPLSIDDVARVGRATRAGRAVWGRVRLTADSVVVRAVLYNTLTGESIREVSRVVRRPGIGALQDVDYAGLVAELITPPRSALLVSHANEGTSSFAALLAYERGAAAVERWDLAAGARELEQAVKADPSFAQAALWLAQVKLWQRQQPTEWAPAYLAADRGRRALPVREQHLLDALAAVANNDLPAACRSYEALRGLDTLDVTAWLGLAHCLGEDHTVVPSAASPTGFAYRVSPERAWRAATRALDIAPASFTVIPYEWLSSVTLVEAGRLRTGTRGTETFAGLPAYAGDTMAYVVIPAARLIATGHPPTVEQALRANRDRMLAQLEMLSRRLPESPDVFEALASLLETRDEIIGTPGGRYSALTALERARALATDSEQRLRLAIADVRLHLKLGDFARSASTTDSILRAQREPSASEARLLAGLAAYGGHLALATRYQRQGGGTSYRSQGVDVPAAEDALAELFIRASLGVCDDSLSRLRNAVEQAITSYVAEVDRARAHDRLLERAMLVMGSCTGGRSAMHIISPTLPLIGAQQAIAREDRAAARRYLDTMDVRRRKLRVLSTDFALQEAWLAEASGDRPRAAARLDKSLAALPTLSTFQLTEVGMAASVGRLMAYRAELADRMHDEATASLWANRVLTLWAHADRELEPTLASMRRLASNRPTR